MVAALAKPGAAIVKTMTPEYAHLIHMLLGMAGEVGEMLESTDRANMVEEFGDFLFYREGFIQGVGFDGTGFDIKPKVEFRIPNLMLTTYVAALIDATKKGAIYEKALNREDIGGALAGIDFALKAWMYDYQITREECIDGNIAKLSKRYADGGYSNKQAQERADKIETPISSTTDVTEPTKPKFIGTDLMDVTNPAEPKPIPKATAPYHDIPKGFHGTEPEHYGDRFDHIAAEEVGKMKMNGGGSAC